MCRYIKMRALASFKKLLEKIYRTHASLVHASVKFKSSCTVSISDVRSGSGKDLFVLAEGTNNLILDYGVLMFWC